MFGSVGTQSLQTDSMPMFGTVQTQPYMRGCNLAHIPAGKDVGANYWWQSDNRMQYEREATLGSSQRVMDNCFDKPVANRIWTPGPLPPKEQPFVSSEAQDGWQPELTDILPSYLVEQLLTSAGSLESKCGQHPSESKCRNSHDKSRPPGNLSVPRKDTKPPAQQQGYEHCVQCGANITVDSNFCRKCGAKCRKDVLRGYETEPDRYKLASLGLWGVPPQAPSPSLSRDASGETSVVLVSDAAPISRGRQHERQAHAYSCVSRTPSPPAVSHLHPLVRKDMIKPPNMLLGQVNVEPLEQDVEQLVKEQFVERPVKHTFIHYDTCSLGDSDDKASQYSEGSTTASERTLNKSATAPSLMMKNLVFNIKSTNNEIKSQSDGLSRMKFLHEQKQCTPCSYFHHKEDGCRLGENCQFCHFCPAGPVKKGKKERSRMRLVMLYERWGRHPKGQKAPK